MPTESLRAAHAATERRPAVWPWLLMPMAALAIFLLLRSVRHATQSAAAGPGVTISDESADSSGP